MAVCWKYALDYKAEDNDLLARKKLALSALNKIGTMIGSISRTNEHISTVCDLAQVINCAVNETLPYAREKGVRLSCNVNDAVVVTDAQKIDRVIVNIINNAIEARGTKKIHLRMVAAEPFIRIEAFDNGDGIDSDKITKIFDHGFTSGKSGGSGFGLSFCKNAIEERGGKITAHSTKGVGTIFAVTLPLGQPNGSPDDSLWE
jgi:signal transduction histidine kinase